MSGIRGRGTARRARARRAGSAVLVAALLWGAAGPARAGSAAPGERGGAGCGASFDRMWGAYNRAFDDRDISGLMAHYRPDAVKVDPDGTFHQGRESIRGLFAELFTLEYASDFREVRRTVAGCRTAVLVVDSTLEFPQWQYTERFLTALSFSRDRGRWRVIANVSSPLPGGSGAGVAGR
jgi:uncharacterized protein (TIGR02246 family)